MSSDEIRTKYRVLTEPVLGGKRAARIERAVDGLASDSAALAALIAELLQGAASDAAENESVR